MPLGNWRTFAVPLAGAALTLSVVVPGRTVAHDDKPQKHTHGTTTHNQHLHAPVPQEYAAQTAPMSVWTDPNALARGQAIYAAKCAVCHGATGPQA
jgi:cytochrome c5